MLVSYSHFNTCVHLHKDTKKKDISSKTPINITEIIIHPLLHDNNNNNLRYKLILKLKQQLNFFLIKTENCKYKICGGNF